MNSKYKYTFILFLLTYLTFAQSVDSTKLSSQFSADIIVSTNGISRIPSLSLMKPAAQFNLFYIHKRWIIDPQFFFSAELKPWINNYWVHYKVVDQPQWNLVGGGSLMVTYKTASIIANNITQDRLLANRYLDLDLQFTKKLNKKWSLSAYYMFAKGLESSSFNFLHFFAIGTPLNTQIKNHYIFKANPQVYYLRQGSMDGYYFSSTLSLRPKQKPFGFFGMINFPIQTKYVPDNGFIWSFGLNCVIGGKYLKKTTI